MCLLFSLGFWKKVCVCVRACVCVWGVDKRYYFPSTVWGQVPRPPSVDAHRRRSLRRTLLDPFLSSRLLPKDWRIGWMSLRLPIFCTDLLYPNSTKYCSILTCRHGPRIWPTRGGGGKLSDGGPATQSPEKGEGLRKRWRLFCKIFDARRAPKIMGF